MPLISDTDICPWAPGCDLDALRARAELLSVLRAFFQARDVMEVETPVLGSTTTPDPNIESVVVAATDRSENPGTNLNPNPRYYLQVSPEFFMKRLLAAGSGAIYQISKAFRAGEAGAMHNPEFTLLEWYRPGFDHHGLMDEVEALVTQVLGAACFERLSYAEVFRAALDVDPLRATDEEIFQVASQRCDDGLAGNLDRDQCLDLLMSTVVQPEFATRRVFVYDFPASQASLARLRPGYPPVAERFELYVDAIELANGFHELRDAHEQRARFEAERSKRSRKGLDVPPLDEHLLAALESGLPTCAGVALGVDRLLLLKLGLRQLDKVLAFAQQRL